MDQIQSMRAFVRVVEAGSFTKAAESLDLPKGTVTKSIQQLEARVKVKLLNRTTRRVTVTPDGAAYYERTARLLNDLDDIEARKSSSFRFAPPLSRQRRRCPPWPMSAATKPLQRRSASRLDVCCPSINPKPAGVSCGASSSSPRKARSGSS